MASSPSSRLPPLTYACPTRPSAFFNHRAIVNFVANKMRLTVTDESSVVLDACARLGLTVGEQPISELARQCYDTLYSSASPQRREAAPLDNPPLNSSPGVVAASATAKSSVSHFAFSNDMFTELKHARGGTIKLIGKDWTPRRERADDAIADAFSMRSIPGRSSIRLQGQARELPRRNLGQVV